MRKNANENGFWGIGQDSNWKYSSQSLQTELISSNYMARFITVIPAPPKSTCSSLNDFTIGSDLR